MYPTFQFVGPGGRPVDRIGQVLKPILATDEPLLAAQWLTTAHDDLDGRTPLAAVADGDVDTTVRAAHGYARALAA